MILAENLQVNPVQRMITLQVPGLELQAKRRVRARAAVFNIKINVN